jgi:hypothetical protein
VVSLSQDNPLHRSPLPLLPNPKVFHCQEQLFGRLLPRGHRLEPVGEGWWGSNIADREEDQIDWKEEMQKKGPISDFLL